MKSVLPAESAELIHLKSVRVVFLVFHCVVIALFALCACQCHFNSHDGTSRFTVIRCTLRYILPLAEHIFAHKEKTLGEV